MEATLEPWHRARQVPAGCERLKPRVHTPPMDRLRSLQYFVETARTGSLSGAARALEVSVPAVTKGLNLLEREMDVRLFDRSPRGLTLTGAGSEYLNACLPALQQLADAEERLRAARQEVAGTVVVGAHEIIARHLLSPALPRFRALFPRIELDLRDYRNFADVNAQGLDVYLAMGWGEAPDLVRKRVAVTAYWLVASPEYLARHGSPQHPSELAHHSCMLLRNTSGKVMDLWPFQRQGERVEVCVKGWLTVSNPHREIFIDAVRAGLGIARSADWTFAEAVREGRLVRLLPEWASTESPPLSVMYRPGATRNASVRAVVEFCTTMMAEVGQRQLGSVEASPPPAWLRGQSKRASGKPLR
jgi:LysR family transcriptional regulator, regulator for bpeEF and oprC